MIPKNIVISPVDIEARRAIDIRAGDTVRVWQKIEEKGKIRLQAFEGLVLARKHGNEPGATFTVRKSIDGVGVERIFPLYTPVIDKIEVLKRSKVRRAKLYHVRKKAEREIKREMRNLRNAETPVGTTAATEEKTEATTEKKTVK
jgi:large subunit ribosomal protein L19